MRLRALFLTAAIAASPLRAMEAPAAFQHALATAQTGDVVDVTGMWSETNPLPGLNVTRTWTGGTLIVSDSPEYVPGPGVLYGDTLSPGSVRLMLYHVNATSEPGNTRQTLKLSVVLEPADVQNPPTVTVRRKIIYGAGSDYMGIGVHAAFDQLSLPDAPEARTITAPTLLDSHLETHTLSSSSSEPLLEAIYDFDISGGNLKFTAVAVNATKNTLSTYASLPVLAREQSSPGVYVHDRGTFPGCAGKLITVANGASYVTNVGMVHIRAGGGLRDTSGPDPDAGEAGEPGRDGLLGISCTMRGNYGVQYHFQLKALNADGRRVAILLNGRGGGITGAVSTPAALTGAGTFYAPSGGAYMPPTTKATVVGRWNPMQTPTIDFQWTPPGATSLPVEFVLVPYPEPGDANGNGQVDLPDAVMALRFAVGQAAPTSRQSIAADYDGSGGITMADVAAILGKAAGLR